MLYQILIYTESKSKGKEQRMLFDENKYKIAEVKGRHGTQWIISEKYRDVKAVEK